jgi:hypothetical protein
MITQAGLYVALNRGHLDAIGWRQGVSEDNGAPSSFAQVTAGLQVTSSVSEQHVEAILQQLALNVIWSDYASPFLCAALNRVVRDANGWRRGVSEDGGASSSFAAALRLQGQAGPLPPDVEAIVRQHWEPHQAQVVVILGVIVILTVMLFCVYFEIQDETGPADTGFITQVIVILDMFLICVYIDSVRRDMSCWRGSHNQTLLGLAQAMVGIATYVTLAPSFISWHAHIMFDTCYVAYLLTAYVRLLGLKVSMRASSECTQQGLCPQARPPLMTNVPYQVNMTGTSLGVACFAC